MKKHLSLLLAILLTATTLFTIGCSSDTPTAGTATGTSSDSGPGEAPVTETVTEAETDDPNEKGYEGRSEFIDQLGGVSDTYKGMVSTESYASASAAAEAYIREEIVGSAEASQLSATSKGVLSDEAVSALKIPAEFTSGIAAVEEMEVSFAITESSDSASAPRLQVLASEIRNVTVYVIKYANDWKYYSPAPVRGDTITKSYYDSVFNAEKYSNCTMTSEMKLVIDYKEIYQGQPDSAYMVTKDTRTVKYENGKVLLTETVEMTMAGETMTQSISVYLEEEDGKILCYAQPDGSDTWVESDLSALGFQSIKELTPFFDQYLDYTYFTKTNYGFALNHENAAQFIRETMANNPAAGDLLNFKEMNIDMFAEYYVVDGVLSGMREDCDVSVNTTYEDLTVIMNMAIEAVTTCTDYGTTHIEKPAAN